MENIPAAALAVTVAAAAAGWGVCVCVGVGVCVPVRVWVCRLGRARLVKVVGFGRRRRKGGRRLCAGVCVCVDV